MKIRKIGHFPFDNDVKGGAGQGNTITAVLDPYGVYVNPYYVVTSFANYENVSKHYFMGSQRVASEIVTYEDPENPGGESQTNSQNELNTANEENEKSEDLEAIKNGLDPSNNKSNPVFTNLTNILTKLGLEENKDFTQEQLKQKHAIEDYYDMDAIASVQQGSTAESGSPRLVTRLRYWYHPNYLGNVDMITDLNGEVNQYYVYSPFGENLYEWSANTLWNTPYRFNGKEHDPETGNSYYGARYYDPKISVWLSVDPLVERSPNQTPYHFVSNNPVMRVDPDGLTDYLFNKKTGKLTVVNGTVDDGPDKIIREVKIFGITIMTQEQQLKGKIENFHNGSITNSKENRTYNYQTYTFSNLSDGEEAYEFMCMTTNVEINKQVLESDGEGRYTRFYTSGEMTILRGHPIVQLRDKEQDPSLTLISDTHNHGNPHGNPDTHGGFGPSGDPGGEDKDYGYAKYLTEQIYTDQTTKPKFFIWRFGSQTEYDQNGIIK